MQNDIDWSQPQRQSKVVLLLIFFKIFKTLLALLVFLIARLLLVKESVADKDISKLLWVLSGALIIYLLIRINDIVIYFYYRFCIIDQQLIIYSGFIIKKKTGIQLSKIQAIHTRQTFLHRLTNSCKLIIDTAGTEKAEVEIKALNIKVAENFQKVLVAKGSAYSRDQVQAPNALVSQQLLRLTSKDIFKLCISENHLKTFLLILIFLIGKMQDFRQYLGFDSLGWVKQYSAGANTTIYSLIAIITIGMLLSIVVSCIKVIIRFYGFTIQLQQADFIIKWGLLEAQQKHILFKKVQLLSWRSTFVRRLMGMSILRLHATIEDENKEEQKIQAPVTDMSQIKTIAGYYQPVLPASHFPFIAIQKKFVIREILLVGLPVSITCTMGLYFIIGWYALLTGVWLLYFGTTSFLYRKYYKVWIGNHAIQIEKGVWGRENILVNFSSIQQVTLKTSPYKRKHHLADIQLHTSGIKINIPFLLKEEASFIADFILANIEFKKEIRQLVLQKQSNESLISKQLRQ